LQAWFGMKEIEEINKMKEKKDEESGFFFH
jgi:hypothetical protein